MDAQLLANGRHVIHAFCCKAQTLNLGDATASLVPPFCHLCASSSVHWRMAVTTIVPPFSVHGNPWATTAIVLPSLCLLYTTCCASPSCLWTKGSFKGVTKIARAVAQKQDHLDFVDHGEPWSYLGSLKGGTKVLALYKSTVICAQLWLSMMY